MSAQLQVRENHQKLEAIETQVNDNTGEIEDLHKRVDFEILWGIRYKLPHHTTIIWSDIIQRHYFRDEINAGAGRRILNFINAHAGARCDISNG